MTEVEVIAALAAELSARDRAYQARFRLPERLAAVALPLAASLGRRAVLLPCYAETLRRLSELVSPEAVYAAGKAAGRWPDRYVAALSACLATPKAERLERRLWRFHRRILRYGGAPAALAEFDGLCRDLRRCSDELLPEVCLAGAAEGFM